MRGIDTKTYMRWAAEMPAWVLERELACRRHEQSRDADPTIRVGNLLVDPLGARVVWRGVTHAVTGRRMEVLYALAQEAAKGKARVGRDYLARRVFRGFAQRDAANNLRTYLCYLDREIPGLIVMTGNRHLGYGLRVEIAGERVA